LSSRPFPFVHRVADKLGKRQKRVPLPGAWGSPEFQDPYRKALAGETAPRIEIGASRSKPGSVAAAVARCESINAARGEKLP
jgi:hypothetical protein